jgi:hypothetical protein
MMEVFLRFLMGLVAVCGAAGVFVILLRFLSSRFIDGMTKRQCWMMVLFVCLVCWACGFTGFVKADVFIDYLTYKF